MREARFDLLPYVKPSSAWVVVLLSGRHIPKRIKGLSND
jgi:hypothetical protein